MTYGFRVTMAAAVLGVMASPAYAYLDPGTGSMILQVLLGGVAGLALAGKLYWHKLLSLFGLRKEPDIRTIDDRKPTIDGSR
jgi:hypothetical protein